MRTRHLILLFLATIFLLAGCDENSKEDNYYGDMVSVKARLSYVNSNGDDLLNSQNSSCYSGIKIYQLVNNSKVEVDFDIAPSTSTTYENNYLGFLLNNENAFYIELNEQDTDTVYGVINEFVDNGIYTKILTKIIYNGNEMTHEGDTTGIFKVLKE